MHAQIEFRSTIAGFAQLHSTAAAGSRGTPIVLGHCTTFDCKCEKETDRKTSICKPLATTAVELKRNQLTVKRPPQVVHVQSVKARSCMLTCASAAITVDWLTLIAAGAEIVLRIFRPRPERESA